MRARSEDIFFKRKKQQPLGKTKWQTLPQVWFLPVATATRPLTGTARSTAEAVKVSKHRDRHVRGRSKKGGLREAGRLLKEALSGQGACRATCLQRRDRSWLKLLRQWFLEPCNLDGGQLKPAGVGRAADKHRCQARRPKFRETLVGPAAHSPQDWGPGG